MTIWTPRALASEARTYAHELWRVVEAQHTASTMRLTDSLEEQAMLEAVLEESKPALPAAVSRLHYLLATPYRYRPHVGSRFRAALEPGVWYGAEALRTALAEKSYWRLRFLLDSPATPDLKPVPHTAFQAAVRTQAALDLTRAPLARERDLWTDRARYESTQALAAAARAAHIELIRYESVRDPQHAACAAVLDPRAFGRARPHALETWFIAAARPRVRCALQGSDVAQFEFTAGELLGER
ncbi:MAG: RES family NAD+ phosphorylase [Gammaproteobacteria bacterium]|nr:RES family NAD+ phosphorylase [Gammaproteobacteria bacterium]MBV8306107.1 RES family NAD+ phosphorylase [Gammaproteobacteria bacterium]